MKSVKDVFTKHKGEGNENKVLTGKGSFSQTSFKDLVHALANDTTHKVSVFNPKDGSETKVNLSELIRSDIKKTTAKAGYPGKTEEKVFDTCEIVTTGLSEAARFFAREYISMGKKLDLPATDKMSGSIYLDEVKGGTKTVAVRDMTTKEDRGTTTITTKDSIRIKAKSPVPKHLQTKVRRDKNGNVIKADKK